MKVLCKKTKNLLYLNKDHICYMKNVWYDADVDEENEHFVP